MTELEAMILRVERILGLEWVDVPIDRIKDVRAEKNLSLQGAKAEARRLRIIEEFDDDMREATK